MSKKKEEILIKKQRLIIGVAVENHHGGESVRRIVKLKCRFDPALPGLNPHAVNFGVAPHERDAALCLNGLENHFKEKGYEVERVPFDEAAPDKG